MATLCKKSVLNDKFECYAGPTMFSKLNTQHEHIIRNEL
ncbi:L-aspartate oxidase [Atlantibacter subterranea]|uniref:L-aspartate oxidase n=1 Tax=Atlantibacter subterraneus TaxID=255519 RepID=A0A3R9F4B4_9ENTR|nr:L-aspartate oxidase [Enterobacter sp. E76]RSB61969.1 L-aspartate oxidase [Atlantibacter subterranea]RSE04533.1 L-aspartate oxidase [Atlantibacter subterranea]RSE25766.1 L-aspartate oxidase [Atlantibacter subterranea]TSJ50929.1 L-aspartate oxidase [Atlantibacter subterranea]